MRYRIRMISRGGLVMDGSRTLDLPDDVAALGAGTRVLEELLQDKTFTHDFNEVQMLDEQERVVMSVAWPLT